jgi:GNAT superfamily N-acetyltransferase
MEGKIAVYDCRSQKEQIDAAVKELQQPDQFNQSVRPWLDGCKDGERYHFVYREGGQIQAWMMVDILTHKGNWRYAYLDKVSARNGTKGVGRQLGEYLKTWAKGRGNIDFIWLWAKNRPVSDIYEKVWGYNRVQYYEDYGFMYFPIKKNPPLSLLQQELPENPRIYWVAADKIAKINPPSQELVRLIANNRRGDVEPVRVILANLMDELPNLDEEGVKDVQQQLIGALPKKGGRRCTRKTKRRIRKTRRRHK